MIYLLDTHTLIWFITEDKILPHKALEKIEDDKTICFVSIASLWEIGIKFSLKKLELHTTLSDLFELIQQSGIRSLPIANRHILTNSSLAFHHRDPFDRLIISQAICENMTIITKDVHFKEYPVEITWN